MKKKQLVELVQERLNGGSINPDVWKKAHPLVVSKYIGMAFESIFYTIFRTNPEGLDLYAKLYEDLEVKQDGKKYYTELPCSLIQLPNNSSSIKRVTLTDDNISATFVPLRLLATGAMSRLGTVGRSGSITYDARDKIYFGSNFNPLIKKVNVFAITPFDDVDDDEEIIIPAGQAGALVDMIIKYFMEVKPSDTATNNNN
jgi:hypothetical protein